MLEQIGGKTGEDFFIGSVRNYRDQIIDLKLQEAIKGFIGQESTRASYHPVRLVRSLNKFRKSSLLRRDAIRRDASYTNRGFHPDEWDNSTTLE
ncbi:MAG: metal-dependent hydrolase [Mycobacterium sp.]